MNIIVREAHSNVNSNVRIAGSNLRSEVQITNHQPGHMVYLEKKNRHLGEALARVVFTKLLHNIIRRYGCSGHTQTHGPF